MDKSNKISTKNSTLKILKKLSIRRYRSVLKRDLVQINKQLATICPNDDPLSGPISIDSYQVARNEARNIFPNHIKNKLSFK